MLKDATRTDHVTFRVGPTGTEHTMLAPVTFSVDAGRANFTEYLTPRQACDLAAALWTQALAVDDGSVMGASDNLVAAADRFDAAVGEGRR